MNAIDVLIIGAGSTGAVLANRLSTDPLRRVLVLEAGPQTLPDDWHHAVLNGHQPAVKPGLNWGFPIGIKATSRPSVFVYHAGRTVGGSSAVNATQALRPRPEDFDDWVRDCGDSWSWKSVLPYFRQLENDPDGADDWHGREGPLPIRREGREELRPLQAGFYQACLDMGFEETDLPPLMEGVRLAWQLLRQPSLTTLLGKRLAWTDKLIDSDTALASAVRTFVRPGAHLCGSARMGDSPEQGAVVNPDGQVFGIDRLYVADASIIPRIPSAPPHLTALMVAEKLAAESSLNR